MISVVHTLLVVGRNETDFRGDPSDVLGIQRIKSDASDMIGLFENHFM